MAYYKATNLKIDNNTIKYDSNGQLTLGQAVSGDGAAIDDEHASLSTTYSSNKIERLVSGGYVLPIADSETLGGVKIDGETITIDEQGYISATSSLSLDIQSPQEGDVLMYSSILQKWTNGTVSSGGSGTSRYNDIYARTSLNLGRAELGNVGINSATIGQENVAAGNYSLVTGEFNTTNCMDGLIAGRNNTVTNTNSYGAFVFGYSNNIDYTGSALLVNGGNNTVTGEVNYSLISGSYNSITGTGIIDGAYLFGEGNTVAYRESQDGSTSDSQIHSIDIIDVFCLGHNNKIYNYAIHSLVVGDSNTLNGGMECFVSGRSNTIYGYESGIIGDSIYCSYNEDPNLRATINKSLVVGSNHSNTGSINNSLVFGSGCGTQSHGIIDYSIVGGLGSGTNGYIRYSNIIGNNLFFTSDTDVEFTTISGSYHIIYDKCETSLISGYHHSIRNPDKKMYSSVHVAGYENDVNGCLIHAEGYMTKAYGDYAHTEGYQTEAYGLQSQASGYKSIANGVCSYAEGNECISGSPLENVVMNKSSDDHELIVETASVSGSAYTHAEGYKAHSYGNYSHAEGYDTVAGSKDNIIVYDTYSWIDPNDSSKGDIQSYKRKPGNVACHAEGYKTQALGNCQHVEGRYNIPDNLSHYAHIVGNGGLSYNKNAEYTIEVETQQDSYYKTKILLYKDGELIESIDWSDSVSDIAVSIETITAYDLLDPLFGVTRAGDEKTDRTVPWYSGFDSNESYQYSIGDKYLQIVKGNPYGYIIRDALWLFDNATINSNAHTIDWNGNAWYAGDIEDGYGNTLSNLSTQTSNLSTSINTINTQIADLEEAIEHIDFELSFVTSEQLASLFDDNDDEYIVDGDIYSV